MSDFKAYVLGIVFDEDCDRVAVMNTKGIYVGIGSQMDDLDKPYNEGMAETFKEITGIDTSIEDWEGFIQMSGENFLSLFFKANMDLDELKKKSKREIHIFDVDDVLNEKDMFPKLRWIIPMGADDIIKNCAVLI